MTTYTNVTQSEIEPFLAVRGFKRVYPAGVHELTFDKEVEHGFTLRIYTGINTNGNSRAKGKDAIRLCLLREERVIGVMTRVNRVWGWRANLDIRLNSWEAMIGPRCPKCGGFMVVRAARKNKKNKFWGCSWYPNCNGIRELKDGDGEGDD